MPYNFNDYNQIVLILIKCFISLYIYITIICNLLYIMFSSLSIHNLIAPISYKVDP